MAQILVRDLEGKTVDRLKKQAKEHGRSLQAEVRSILEGVAGKMTMAEFRATADRLRKSLGGRRHTDSALLIREDRDR
jgi:antitoxin FitA